MQKNKYAANVHIIKCVHNLRYVQWRPTNNVHYNRNKVGVNKEIFVIYLCGPPAYDHKEF